MKMFNKIKGNQMKMFNKMWRNLLPNILENNELQC